MVNSYVSGVFIIISLIISSGMQENETTAPIFSDYKKPIFGSYKYNPLNQMFESLNSTGAVTTIQNETTTSTTSAPAPEDTTRVISEEVSPNVEAEKTTKMEVDDTFRKTIKLNSSAVHNTKPKQASHFRTSNKKKYFNLTE